MTYQEVYGMGTYQLSLRQRILKPKDVPASEIVFRVPREEADLEEDYSVIVKYDQVWWPEPDLLTDTKPAHLHDIASCLPARFETKGTA